MEPDKQKLPDQIRFLCIEGVIGVGKTSLCHLLRRKFDARLVLEAAEENPFLSKFYADRKSYAFQTQLWFLVSRYRQLSETFEQQELFTDVTITDYMFAKDNIFASINLDENELSLYNTISKNLQRDVARPDFVVYLQASTDVLLQRIEKRGRSFEFNMDPEYLALLNEAYNHYFFHYTGSPLLIINTSDIDFVEYEADLDDIVNQIITMKTGTNFYAPLGSKEKGRTRSSRSLPI
jgi:deoxyguanosine kinase